MTAASEWTAGQALHVLRRIAGLTRDQAAELTDTSAEYLSGVERGDVATTARYLARMTDALARHIQRAARRAEDEEWYRTFAAENVVLVTSGPTPGPPAQVGIIGDSGALELTLDKTAARAIAVRLVELASELPDPPRTLRRDVGIIDRLRDLDD